MNIKYLTYDAVVVGTGAAGYNAALRINQEGNKSVCIVTEGVNTGTSRNTGSDKQTYYKLGLGGDSADSVRKMAENLFSCGSMDGDTALCEAALSARCFLNLAEAGVQFPVNRYGEYVGYKTDHDPYARATSAGPLTSKFMTEALEKRAKAQNIPVYDNLLAIEVLKNSENEAIGLLCLNLNDNSYVAFRSTAVVLCTGGPAGIYADSVYPECHTGTSSLALLAGASLQNMTEWQYGLASINPRWNVSGTYMQVLPRFVSVDADGNEYEFLADYFSDIYEALSLVFLKGYQWPFDSKKVLEGSSVIDLLVYRECVLKNRRVYLDYTKNPFSLDNIKYEKLSKDAYEYLYKAEALFGTPIERLKKMNMPAIELYRSKGLDIETEYLEIALCAQHNNGGIAVDLWWQTSIRGLFAAGECAGTHGVTRPGGSALNSGQVGSLRASMYISQDKRELTNEIEFSEILKAALIRQDNFLDNVKGGMENVRDLIKLAQRKMSDCGAAIRNPEMMSAYLSEIKDELKNFEKKVKVGELRNLFLAYKLYDILYTQLATLTALIDFSETIGATRGSALYGDKNGELRNGLDELFRFTVENGESFKKIQEVKLCEDKLSATTLWRDVRPFVDEEDFFENVWRRYREDKNIY
ncbi:MAG: FAD-binding protein [Ruminococcaceae bacterium]|nr:FAD-binding protein [Oscillospiraceae bacterium]